MNISAQGGHVSFQCVKRSYAFEESGDAVKSCRIKPLTSQSPQSTCIANSKMNPNLLRNHHLRLPGFISAKRARILAQEFRHLEMVGGCIRDPQAPQSPAAYNFLPFVRLLVQKNPVVSELCGEPVLPTYANGRLYRHGEPLGRHRDRDACEISITLNLAQDTPWPLYIDSPKSKAIRMDLEPGDAMLYLGCETDHWRDYYTGHNHAQIFLHYVIANGPRAYAFFDRQKTPPNPSVPGTAIL